MSIDGRWRGSFTFFGIRLDVEVEFRSGPGGLTGTMDVPSRGQTGLALTNVSFEPPPGTV